MCSRAIARFFAFAVSAAVLGVPAHAYYHYIYYQSRFAPFTPIRAQFNLAALPNNTVTFFVSDAGPSTYYPNDSFGSVLGEVKQALAVWNSVNGSNLRVAFGGTESSSQPAANTPGADIVFQELAPGLLGLGTPNLPVNPAIINGPNGQFVPISRSTVILTSNTDYTDYGPFQSYLESYFTTVVHEIGHALGLQHTWTGAAMSQDVIRNTSRARPIDVDDQAALLVLYGAQNWNAAYGTISGSVTFTNGNAANLASVVAISPTGPAISTLTNPDGTYQIQGVPPGAYQVYVHPLPPDAAPVNGTGLLLPADFTGRSFPASGVFAAQFYPGTTNPGAAASVNVTAGAGNQNFVNFLVASKAAVPMYDMLTFSYFGQTAVTPAYANVTSGAFQIFVEPDTPPASTPSFINLLGVGNATNVSAAGNNGWFLTFNVPQGQQAAGPRHLMFNFGSDMYVLPDAINFTLKAPPSIAFGAQNFDGTVTLQGNNFGPDSRVFFDGLQASSTLNNGALNVTPPSGNSGQVSTLTVFNGDAQNSMLLQSSNPQTFTYPSLPQQQIQAVTPQTLTAGVSSLVTINGVNTNFVAGQVSVGFGTSDVLVNNVWVVSPTQVLANVTLSPNAAQGNFELSVISGFQVMTQPFAFQIQPANPALPEIAWPALNASTGGAVNPGSYVSIFPANGTLFPANLQLTLSGSPVPIQYNSPTQINFFVSPGMPLGPAVLTVASGGNSVSIVVEIDSPPSTLQSQLKQ
jgi:Carboxypeptidase regulatory-like domain/Matrixin/IPT/TIG domain